MEITSPEFEHNGMMPLQFTCDGNNVNPKLEIKDIPPSAESLALIVDDPDASGGDWVHWLVCNIPAQTKEITETEVPGKIGVNDTGGTDYRGPCPPSGTHRYFFKLYALDTRLDLNEGFTKQDLLNAMKGHVLDKAELVGLYKWL